VFLAADQYTSTADAEEELFRRFVQKPCLRRTVSEALFEKHCLRRNVSEDLVLKEELLTSDTPDIPKEAVKQFSTTVISSQA